MKRWLQVLLECLPGVLLALVAFVLLLALIGYFSGHRGAAAENAPRNQLDPAAWGSDHVGQPVPVYTEGGECLFCHRHQVGTTWGANKHNRTIRDADPAEPAMAALLDDDKTKALAADVQLLLGDTRAQRFLKRSERYGHADLLSVKAEFGRGARARLKDTDAVQWDLEKFATQCAGCHATAVDPESQSFATVSLDCYACHGDAPVDHATDTALMPLARERRDSPAVVSSICGSCHIRFGKSRSTGLPYPANFVAGDNLFKDFEVDWSVLDETTDAKRLNPADAHVMDNLREVVLYGNEQMTCLTCHDVHKGASAKHRELPATQYCQHCHTASVPIRAHKRYTVHSERCEY